MAAPLFMSHLPDLRPHNAARGVDYLRLVAQLVSQSKPLKLKLKKPAGAVIRFGGLEDTIYKEWPDVADGWDKFYLPKEENMQVVGVVEVPSCNEIVLMTCENKKVYAFDGEELHLVAASLIKLLEDREMQFPGKETYYYGQAFQNMSEKDWRAVKAGPAGKKLEDEYKRMVAAKKSAFLQKIKAAAH